MVAMGLVPVLEVQAPAAEADVAGLVMSTSRMDTDPEDEEATSLLAALEVEQPDLVKRWVDLERAREGVEEISVLVYPFISQRRPATKPIDTFTMFMAMRGVINRRG